VFQTFLILSCGILGKSDSVRGTESTRVISISLWATVIIAVTGVVLAIVSPGRFGFFSLDIARNARGEISLWIFTGVHYTPAALATGMLASRTWHQFSPMTRGAVISLASLVLITHIGGANRNETFSFAVILACVLLARPGLTSIIVPAVSFVAVVFWSEIVTFFMLTEESDLIEASNGRAELWRYFWDHIGDNPFIGVGEHFLGRVTDYGDGPSSEIGMLAVFTEKGWIFGTLLALFLIRAFVRAITILRRRPNPFACAVASYVIGLSTKFWIQGGSWPAADVLFWYSVVFTNCYQCVSETKDASLNAQIAGGSHDQDLLIQEHY
jgi:hypothetical protein